MPTPIKKGGASPKRLKKEEKLVKLEKELRDIIKEMILFVDPNLSANVAFANAAVIVADIKSHYGF